MYSVNPVHVRPVHPPVTPADTRSAPRPPQDDLYNRPSTESSISFSSAGNAVDYTGETITSLERSVAYPVAILSFRTGENIQR